MKIKKNINFIRHPDSAFAAGAAADTVIENILVQRRPDITVMIDGEKKSFQNVNGDTVPLMAEGATYPPVRGIGKIMG